MRGASRRVAAAFAGRACWVTGASSGIGRELSTQLARAGARLVLSGRDLVRLGEAREEALDAGAQAAVVLPGALDDPAGLDEHAAEAARTHGGLDAWLHAAGLTQRSPAEDTSPDVEELILRVNTLAPLRLARGVLPALRLSRGRLVVVSSIVGHFGAPRRAAYAASKHALHGYFDSLRLELAGSGPSVTLACPGPVATGIGDRAPDRGHEPEPDDAVSAESCARRILDAAAARRREVLIGGGATTAVHLRRWAPGLLDRLLIARDRRAQTPGEDPS